ncbi:MAG TPA: hypothetical protein VIU15_38660 [Streptomyces sp.]
MRLRTTLAAAVGALALTVAVPTSASAATGQFFYVYSGLDGSPQVAALTDPRSGECVTLPEVADPGASSPARSPRNRTDATAVVFTNPDCTGDYYVLNPFVGGAGPRLELRSVFFS